mgnify:FL=1
MEEIKLYDHNEEGYQSIIKSLEDSNFSFIERATGTGKSYILIKYLATQMAGKRVLFVTTHEPMFDQLVNRDMPLLGTSKEIYDKLDLVIYPNINKNSAKYYFDNYDCFIFDEAHHCGATVWGETIGELRDLIKTSEDKVMIGATATGTRYLDDYMDVAKVFFDNNVASRLTLSQAILKEILPAPLYININYSAQESLNSIKSKLKKLPNTEEFIPLRKKQEELQKKLNIECDVNKLLKENGVKGGEKYIVFCSSISELEQKKQNAEEWFKGIGKISIYQAHSKQNKNENQNQINDFSKPSDNNEIKLMFAVDIFNEGMHINGVDGVIMTRHTTSPIIYLQQIGRALSFSVRKKQIKIFDLVGNATDIDVVYELYKELLHEAEKMIKENPENKKHYENIIERFKIIEQNSSLIDSINELENYLNCNYIIKNKLEKDINFMEAYTSILKEPFMELLINNKIDKVHMGIYNELVKYANYLSIDDLLKLTSIGVIISNWQRDQETLDLISKYGSLTQSINAEYINTINKYNEFYLENKRRPDGRDEQEKILKERYRYYLTNIRPSKLRSSLKKVSYKLNVEEILINNGYPEKEDINDYLDMIEKKYINGQKIDSLEIKTLNKIKLIVDLNNRQIIQDLINNKVLKIDNCIKIIQEFIANHPDDDKLTLMLAIFDKDVAAAYKYIDKNYKYVTNEQYDIICGLNMELPPSFDKNREERLKNLNGYDSYYEKENILSYKTSKDIVNFIKLNKRRPDSNNKDEVMLYKTYNNLLSKNSRWFNLISDSLIENSIELSLEEKIITGKTISNTELKEIYTSVLSNIRDCNKDSFVYSIELKKLKVLKKHNVIDSREYKILNRTINMINSVFADDLNEKQIKVLSESIWSNKDIIPYNLIYYIRNKGITLPKTYISIIAATSKDGINRAHNIYMNDTKQYRDFFKYIENNGNRPEHDDSLSSFIRNYLLNCSGHDRNVYIHALNDLKVPILMEELYIANQLSDNAINNLYNKLLLKKDNDIPFDILEKYCFDSISLRRVDKSTKVRLYDNYTYDTKQSISDEVINQIKKTIINNPHVDLDFNGELSILSDSDKKEISEFQLDLTAGEFIYSLIQRIKRENNTLDKILSFDEAQKLSDIRRLSKKNNKNEDLLNELDNLDKEILFKKNEANISGMIDELINFVKTNKQMPNKSSDDPTEKKIAEDLEIIKNIISEQEYSKILTLARKILLTEKKDSFYDEFVSFIEKNERFPTKLSNDPEEIKLAEQYQKDGTKFNLEQKKHITMLQKKYQLNNIALLRKMKGR